jgi:hypothetical protein
MQERLICVIHELDQESVGIKEQKGVVEMGQVLQVEISGANLVALSLSQVPTLIVRNSPFCRRPRALAAAGSWSDVAAAHALLTRSLVELRFGIMAMHVLDAAPTVVTAADVQSALGSSVGRVFSALCLCIAIREAFCSAMIWCVSAFSVRIAAASIETRRARSALHWAVSFLECLVGSGSTGVEPGPGFQLWRRGLIDLTADVICTDIEDVNCPNTDVLMSATKVGLAKRFNVEVSLAQRGVAQNMRLR